MEGGKKGGRREKEWKKQKRKKGERIRKWRGSKRGRGRNKGEIKGGERRKDMKELERGEWVRKNGDGREEGGKEEKGREGRGREGRNSAIILVFVLSFSFLYLSICPYLLLTFLFFSTHK